MQNIGKRLSLIYLRKLSIGEKDENVTKCKRFNQRFKKQRMLKFYYLLSKNIVPYSSLNQKENSNFPACKNFKNQRTRKNSHPNKHTIII